MLDEAHIGAWPVTTDCVVAMNSCENNMHSMAVRASYLSRDNDFLSLAIVEKTAMPSVRAPVCPSPPSPPVHPDSPPALPASTLPAWLGVAACRKGDELCNPRQGTAAVAPGTNLTLCVEPVLTPYFLLQHPAAPQPWHSAHA